MQVPILVIGFVLIASVSCDADRPVVKTAIGKIRGVYRTSENGRTFSEFKGVPYAEPPVGSLRFKDPVYRKIWGGIWDANNEYECVQIMTLGKPAIIGQEDCLYMNINVPRAKINPKDKLNVLVHIHGGAFMIGGKDFYTGPKYLMDRDVILISINYRLGPFGFLSMENDIVSGNMGLKDQTMVLIWIKENIKHFGGNPDSITLTGLSAGGASVHFHYFSEKSRGLFKRGYSTSGSALAPWAMAENSRKKTEKLADLVGCANKNDELMIKCMRSRPAKQIIEASKAFYTYRDSFPFSPFAPTVEGDRSNAFLKQHPYKMLKTGKGVADVPWITSVTSEEGIYPAGMLYNVIDEVEEKWDTVIPEILDYEGTAPKSERKTLARKLRDFYLDGKPLTKDNFNGFIKLNSDRHFVVSSETAARMQAKINKSPVYFYVFGYRGDTTFGTFYGSSDYLGVSHGDDALVTYSSIYAGDVRSANDKKMIDLFLDMITGYCKNGSTKFGGVNWTAVDNSEELSYLNIHGIDKYSMEKTTELYSKQFWNQLQLAENENFKQKIVKVEL